MLWNSQQFLHAHVEIDSSENDSLFDIMRLLPIRLNSTRFLQVLKPLLETFFEIIIKLSAVGHVVLVQSYNCGNDFSVERNRVRIEFVVYSREKLSHVVVGTILNTLEPCVQTLFAPFFLSQLLVQREPCNLGACRFSALQPVLQSVLLNARGFISEPLIWLTFDNVDLVCISFDHCDLRREAAAQNHHSCGEACPAT